MIKCPKCGHEQIFVVEFTAGNDKKFKDGVNLPRPIELEETGFEWWDIAPNMRDYSTEDEIAQCGLCGKKGDLHVFGFGEE
jgi:hypothetical protein